MLCSASQCPWFRELKASSKDVPDPARKRNEAKRSKKSLRMPMLNFLSEVA